MKTERRWTLRACHRTSAVILGAFLAAHLTNHIVGLWGQADHMAFMHSVRPLYRNAIVEPLLLTLFASQILSGLVMVARGWRSRHGFVAWLQAGSGFYLSVFITIHAVSVLSGRSVLGLDTDFRFAAAGFHVPGWPWYFWPYYSLAVFALFAHVGCAVFWGVREHHPRAAIIALRSMAGMGAVLGLLIASALAGKLYPVDVPSRYKATYTGS